MRKQLTMIVCVALAASVASADWPQFLGSTRDGKSAERIADTIAEKL